MPSSSIPRASISRGTIGYTTYAQHKKMVRWINIVFASFGVFATLDFFAGIYMLTAIRADHDYFVDFIDLHAVVSPTLGGSCICEADQLCFADSANNCSVGGPCNVLRQLQNAKITEDQETSKKLCHVDELVDTTTSTNVCELRDGMETLVDELSNLWFAYLGFMVLSAVLTTYYLIQLWRKWKSKLRTVPMVAPGYGGSEVNADGRPYFAPPQEHWPGKPAAPTYENSKKKKNTSSSSAVGATLSMTQIYDCEGCKARDSGNEIYCRVCGRARPGVAINMKPAKLKKKHNEEVAFRKTMEKYVGNFLIVAGVRIAILVFEGIPQAIMVIYYIILLDKPTGLSCSECTVNGELCEFGGAFDSGAVWFIVFGEACSVLLLLGQVIYIRSLSDRENISASFCGIDSLLAAVALPAAASPVIIALLVTPAKEIADIGPTAELVCIVLVCIFLLPWAIALFIGAFFCGELIGLDAVCYSCIDCGDCGCCDCLAMCGDFCMCC